MASMVCVVLLGGLAILPTQKAMAAPKAMAGSTSNTVLLLHGWNGNSSQDCNSGSEWGTLENFLPNYGITHHVSLGFYNADYDCNNYIQGESYHCTGWYDSGSNDGTVNEDIRHTSCELAWFIWDNYTQYGHYVEVIAHSMGGILIRQAMTDTQFFTALPPYLEITDVATAETPHQGILSVSAWAAVFSANCASPCVEVTQMEDTNPIMVNLNSTSAYCNLGWCGFGRNPQGSGGTDWTNISSQNDPVMEAAGNLNPEQMGCYYGTECQIMAVGWMPGAKHFVGYPGSNPSYDHGSVLTDTRTSWTATEDWSDSNGANWDKANTSEYSLYTLTYAALYSNW
jgi:hypothetical protein